MSGHAKCECGEEMIPYGACLFVRVHKTSRSRGVDRIVYGCEDDDWGAGEGPCHDCNVGEGYPHHVGCDAERCPSCGGQFISCECRLDYLSKPKVKSTNGGK